MGVWDVATRHSTATWIWYALTSLGTSWSWMPPTGAMSLHSLHMVSLVVSSWTHIEESCLAISWWQHAFQTREFEVCLQVTWKHFLTIFFSLKKTQTNKQTNKNSSSIIPLWGQNDNSASTKENSSLEQFWKTILGFLGNSPHLLHLVFSRQFLWLPLVQSDLFLWRASAQDMQMTSTLAWSVAFCALWEQLIELIDVKLVSFWTLCDFVFVICGSRFQKIREKPEKWNYLEL